jgi:ADP-ribose pyrophosphatase YjhB (NUDIX family)
LNDYVASMRQKVGNETLLLVGCGAIIEDTAGRILLQKRRSGSWGVPGGFIEIGETYIEAVKREVLEETGLSIIDPELFGIYSGTQCYGEYPNGDKIFSLQIIFHANVYIGELREEDLECEFV